MLTTPSYRTKIIKFVQSLTPPYFHQIVIMFRVLCLFRFYFLGSLLHIQYCICVRVCFLMVMVFFEAISYKQYPESENLSIVSYPQTEEVIVCFLYQSHLFPLILYFPSKRWIRCLFMWSSLSKINIYLISCILDISKMFGCLRQGKNFNHQSGRLYPIGQIFRFASLWNYLQIIDAGSDGNSQLVPINHSTKSNAFSLSPCCLGEEIIILGEKGSTQFAGSI